MTVNLAFCLGSGEEMSPTLLATASQGGYWYALKLKKQRSQQEMHCSGEQLNQQVR
jgi:hypothetical protein